MVPCSVRLFEKVIANMKVTGGTARGRSIAGPSGLKVRPTSSKVRQALFNILGAKVIEARFLDICAGTGLIGIEALSRGAGSLVAIEENKRSAHAIEKSLQLLQMSGKVYAADFRLILPKLMPVKFDIIFADPPYKTGLGQAALEKISESDLLAHGGVFILEHLPQYAAADATQVLYRSDRRTYGDTVLSFYRSISEA